MLVSRRPGSFSSALLAASILLAASWGPRETLGETVYSTTLNNMVTTVFGAVYPNTSPHYDAIDFQTGDGGVLWVDQNVDFNGSTLSNVFTSTKFSSTGGRVSASLLGTDAFVTPIDGREFIVQKFALDNVNLTTSDGSTGGVTLKIQGLAGGDTALSLANSTLSCALIPHFYVPSTLAFTVSGSSQIDGWKGLANSPTVLDVASGGSLRIKDSGDTATVIKSNKLYFAQYGNTATLDASSLVIDNSAVIFGRDPLGDPAKESTMTFRNGASLQITGLNPTSSLETDNIVLQGSTLALATNNSRLALRNDLTLEDSSATIASYAHAETNRIVVSGNSSVAVGTNASVRTATLGIVSGATLSLMGGGDDIGTMRVTKEVLFPVTGTGTLTIGNIVALLELTDGATMDVTAHANVVNNGSITLQDGRMTVHGGASVANNMELLVQSTGTLSVVGDASIGQDSGQHGFVTMEGVLTFGDSPTPAANTLSTTNQLDLGSSSTLRMAIDPTARTSDSILIANSAREFTIGYGAALDLQVFNDAVLPTGTKFLLIDYPDWQVAMAASFKGLPDGAMFTLGLNTYAINYNDGAYRPAEGSTFITLSVTAVPEIDPAGAGSVLALVCGALGLFERRRSAKAAA
ncbi:MAG: hypothetical protein ACKOTB_04375 [Planctomycetia bacterium]